jgi:DNA-binding transcriptional MerR regulator
MFFKISDVAAMAEIEAHVLRYWESEFAELRPRKSHTGRRLYTRKDIETVMEIRSLLYDEGFSIAGAKKRLQKRKKTADDKDAIIETVRQTRKGLEEILAILNR